MKKIKVTAKEIIAQQGYDPDQPPAVLTTYDALGQPPSNWTPIYYDEIYKHLEADTGNAAWLQTPAGAVAVFHGAG